MRIYPFLLVVPLASIALYACGTAAEPPPGSDAGPEADLDVVLEGDVSDETFVALKSALEQGAPKADPAKAATLVSPTNGAMLPSATVPTFTWTIGPMTGQRTPASSRRHAGLELLPLKPATESAWTPLRSLFGPIPSAHAHGDPFNGTGTFLVFSTDSDPKLVRAFTGVLTYTPSMDAWGKLTAAGKPITLTLVSAVFDQDRITQGGGPFAGSTIKFTVAK